MNQLQEKERYFAAHWFQCVGMRSNGRHTRYVDGHFINQEYDEDSFLLLKSLSSITDEDAIEVARILGLDMNDIERDEKGAVVSSSDKEIGFAILNDGTFRIYGWISDTISYQDVLKIYDYLRSKSYALPYGNRTVEELIELKWLKINEG